MASLLAPADTRAQGREARAQAREARAQAREARAQAREARVQAREARAQTRKARAQGGLSSDRSPSVSEPVEIDDPPSGLDWTVAGAQILASLAALGALLFLARQVNRAKEQIVGARDDANAQRALAFQERYTSREFSRIVSPVLAYFRVADADDCVAKIRGEITAVHAEEPCLPRTPRDPSAPHACVNDIQHVLGFFEDLGTAHDKELINRDVLLLSFGNAPVQIFMEAWWYIVWQREGMLGGETKLFLEFERLVRWLVANEPEFENLAPRPAGRLLVLPRDGRLASEGTWQLCRDFSMALSEYLGEDPAVQIETVREEIERILEEMGPKAGADLFSEVIPIPTGLDVEPDVWTAQRQETMALYQHLVGLDPGQARTVIQALHEAKN